MRKLMLGSLLSIIGLVSAANAANLNRDYTFVCKYVNTSGEPIRLQVDTNKFGLAEIAYVPPGGHEEGVNSRLGEYTIVDGIIQFYVEAPVARPGERHPLATQRNQMFPVFKLQWIPPKRKGGVSKKWKLIAQDSLFTAEGGKDTVCTEYE